MVKLLLAIHLVLAVFAIGPLVHAATTAGRGVRRGDGAATAASARVLRIYGYVSVLVVIAGMALMSQKRNGQRIADFGDTWIWLSLVLWVVAVVLVLALIVPTLQQATRRIEAQESVVALTGRVAAAGGVVGLIFAVIVVLMAYRPGS
jgi:uncharacterized membrane protein